MGREGATSGAAKLGNGSGFAVKFAPGGVLIDNNGLCLNRNTILDTMSILISGIACYLMQFGADRTQSFTRVQGPPVSYGLVLTLKIELKPPFSCKQMIPISMLGRLLTASNLLQFGNEQETTLDTGALEPPVSCGLVII